MSSKPVTLGNGTGGSNPFILDGAKGQTSTGEKVNYQRNGSNGAGWYNSSGQFVAPSTTGSLVDSQGVHIVNTSSSQSMPTQTVVAGGGGTGGGGNAEGSNPTQKAMPTRKVQNLDEPW